jgi:hypothetical protein
MHTDIGRSFGRILTAAIILLSLAFVMPAASAGAQDNPDTITIALNEYQDSGVSGWATLTAAGQGIDVQMAVEGDQVTGDHPTHIHTGTCDNFDPSPTFPLTTIVLDPLSADGVSESSVPDVTLDELLSGDYVILVHKSKDELTNYFVCGDIKTSNAIAAPAAGAAGTVSMAETGTGSSLGPVSSDDWIVRISMLAALVLAYIAFQMRRRSANA